MQLLVETKPISEIVFDKSDQDNVPFNYTDLKQPYIVWLPNAKIFVSALPMFDAEGNLEAWTMTDKNGGFYGLPLDDQPSHYVDGLSATAIEQGSASLPIIEVVEEAPQE